MTSLNIQQSTQSSETVTSALIEKLYNLAINSTVEDENNSLEMSLTGSIYTNAAYETSVQYLREKFPNLTITVRDNNFYIKFADSEVERVLVNHVSSDGIGMSKTDAQNLTTLPVQLFKDNTTIQTFDELRLFGNIEIGGECFRNATNLSSIDLTNVTRVKGSNSFEKCRNLSIKLNMPNLISLGQFSFRSSGITEIENLGHITEIPGYNGACFYNCSNLTKVTLPQSCVELGDGCFIGCNNLTTISPTQYLTTLSATCLRTLGNITSIMNFANVTEVTQMCGNLGFASGNTRTTFKQIYLPKLVTPKDKTGYANNSNTYYRNGVFQDVGTDILYLRDIQNFYGASFSNCQITALVINNTTPPTIHYNKDFTQQEYESWQTQQGGTQWKGAPEDLFVLASITTIYVPDSAVNTYKNDSMWSNWASKIDSMNNLTKVATEADLQEGQIALIEAYM